MELSSSNIRKFLKFSQKKAFLIFREMDFFYILGNGNPEKISIYSQKKAFLTFQEMNPTPPPPPPPPPYFRKQNFLIF